MKLSKPQDKKKLITDNGESRAIHEDKERLLSARVTVNPDTTGGEQINHDAVARQQMDSMNELIKRMHKKP